MNISGNRQLNLYFRSVSFKGFSIDPLTMSVQIRTVLLLYVAPPRTSPWNGRRMAKEWKKKNNVYLCLFTSGDDKFSQGSFVRAAG